MNLTSNYKKQLYRVTNEIYHKIHLLKGKMAPNQKKNREGGSLLSAYRLYREIDRCKDENCGLCFTNFLWADGIKIGLETNNERRAN